MRSSAGLLVASAIGSTRSRGEQQLFLLGDADRNQIRQPQRLERVVRGGQLPLASVDQNQIGKRPAVLEHFRDTGACTTSLHRGEVVQDSRSMAEGPRRRLRSSVLDLAASDPRTSDPKLPILAPLHPAVLADHHRRDRLAPLDRGDVEAVDPARNGRQAEDGAQGFERVVVGGDGLVEARLIGHLRVARGEFEQAALFSALGHDEPDLMVAAIGQPRLQRPRSPSR